MRKGGGGDSDEGGDEREEVERMIGEVEKDKWCEEKGVRKSKGKRREVDGKEGEITSQQR